MDTLLHNRSICRKNGAPFLSLMETLSTHTHIASACLLQDKKKIGWFKHKKHLEKKKKNTSNNAEQNQTRFQKQRALESDNWGECPELPETDSQEVFWSWAQSDLCTPVQISAGRLVEWTRPSNPWIPEKTFFSQFLVMTPCSSS